MTKSMKLPVASTIGACLAAGVFFTPVAQGQEVEPNNSISFELGAGALVAPSYEGSSRYEVNATALGRINSLKLGSLSFGGDDTTGFSVGPSFRYLSERTAVDDPILAGIPSVDASLELGLSASYEWDYARVFGQARYGVTGHNGWVGEMGADALFRPDSQLKISVGPRISFANDTYMDTYFSVPATAVNLAPFSASSGFKSAGIEAAFRYDVDEAWAVEGSAQWNRMIGDAAKSPIVKAGDKDQYVGKLLLIRKFNFDF